jgi:hypothetical protein
MDTAVVKSLSPVKSLPLVNSLSLPQRLKNRLLPHRKSLGFHQ